MHSIIVWWLTHFITKAINDELNRLTIRTREFHIAKATFLCTIIVFIQLVYLIFYYRIKIVEIGRELKVLAKPIAFVAGGERLEAQISRGKNGSRCPVESTDTNQIGINSRKKD